MRDPLNPYPGNLKRHVVELQTLRGMSNRREPLPLSKLATTDGEHFMVKYYEAARAKDAELIQRLVNAVAMLRAVHSVATGYDTVTGVDELAAADAHGFKPTEP